MTVYEKYNLPSSPFFWGISMMFDWSGSVYAQYAESVKNRKALQMLTSDFTAVYKDIAKVYQKQKNAETTR
jgi:hypothetical protein